ncbi:hypothetical protein [Nannocystis pusilla]|uniref:hypothetical protein n=1 Tax=Nannocystis pusilla TaxID=889268 RepID=UPI003B805062
MAIDVATTLPVRGLTSFTVVGPEALTSVDAALHLTRAAAKGSISEPIEPDMSYALFFPDQRNSVELRVLAASTELGKLCADPPAAWFVSTSTTPGQCTAPAASDDEFTSFIPVARVVTAGECRLDVELPGTLTAGRPGFAPPGDRGARRGRRARRRRRRGVRRRSPAVSP